MFWLAISCAAAPAFAQPSAADKKAAAEAFDRGTAKWLSKDYADAARYFETAHRLAPAAGALVQAVRSHDRAGNGLRAATLALRLESLYPDDKLAKKTARAILKKSTKKHTRVNVKCDGCTIEVDGKLVDYPSFFVEADRKSSVEASFETGSVQKEVQGGAGETVEVAFDAPPPKPEAPKDPKPSPPLEPDAGAAPAPIKDDADDEPAVSWVVPVVLGGLTVVAGGALVWSGLDTLSERDVYEADPTRDRFERGRDLELRTNVLIGVTAVLGAAAITTTFLALPSGEPERDSAGLGATLSVGPGSASGAIRGTF